MLPFSVQFRPGEPPYEEIVRATKKALALGQLSPGDSFPSVRTLSRELRLNPNTCQKAAAALTAEGILVVQPGIGSIVAEAPLLTRSEIGELLDEPIRQLVIEARRLGASPEDLGRLIGEKWNALS